jgi:hypothetical protein
LSPDRGIDVNIPGQPTQLARPAGIQLADIGGDGHQHIDLVYFATGSPGDALPDVGWFANEEWPQLDLTEEVEAWCNAAILWAASNPG